MRALDIIAQVARAEREMTGKTVRQQAGGILHLPAGLGRAIGQRGGAGRDDVGCAMNAPVLAQPATDLGLAQSIEPVVAIAVACELFQVDYRAVLSHRRDPSLDEARAFIVWMLRSFGEPHSYPAIGRALDRDHTTIINSHLMAVRLRLTTPHFARACDTVARRHAELMEAIHGH
jgi:hypothetical protein